MTDLTRRDLLKLAAAPLALPLAAALPAFAQPACMNPGPPGQLGPEFPAGKITSRYFDIENGVEVHSPKDKWHASLAILPDGSVAHLGLSCTWDVPPGELITTSTPDWAHLSDEQHRQMLHQFADYGHWGPTKTYGWVQRSVNPANPHSDYRRLSFELDHATRRLIRISYYRSCWPPEDPPRELPLEPLA